MPKIKYTAAKGLVQEAGSGVEFQAETVSFSSTPFSPVQTISANGTVTTPGVYAITSSTGGAKTVALPVISSFPGATFIFRTLSEDAHVLTANAADGKAFAGQAGASPEISGSSLTFTAKIGHSAVLVNDGKSYCIVGGSGSFALS